MSESDVDLAHHYPAAAELPWQDVIGVLVEHAELRGDAPYLTAVAGDGVATTLTYRDAEVASRRLAAWLRAESGAAAGSVLALAPANDVESVLAVLGALRAGYALLMLGPLDPPERHAEQIAAVGAEVFLRVAPHARAGEVRLPDWRGLPDAEFTDIPAEPSADALLFGTSGSTAASKLVVQSHRNMMANAAALGAHHGLRPGDRVLGCLPVHHVNGLHFTVIGTLVAGAHTVLADSFSPFTYPDLLDRYRPRIASVVPSILEALVETWRAPALPAGFDYFVSAAAALPAETARKVWTGLGARVVQGYGLSETTNFSTTMPPDLPPDAYRAAMLETDIPPVGIALSGNTVAVLDNACRPVPPGEVGEVCMRGANVMSRYAGNPVATAEAFRGGWFHSQDLGFLRRDARTGAEFLVLTGRIKNIAKVSGETVSLDEMDRVLRALPQVRDAACVAVTDRFRGESVVAAVVLAEGGGEGDAALRNRLRAAFPEAVLPTRFVHMAAIPRSATGKVLRPQLSAQIAGPAAAR